MKLAWLCYLDDPDYPEVNIVFEEPGRHTSYSRVVPIVYTEIVE